MQRIIVIVLLVLFVAPVAWADSPVASLEGWWSALISDIQSNVLMWVESLGDVLAVEPAPPEVPVTDAGPLIVVEG